MKYKGFIAKITFDEDDNIFVGRVINTKHLIAFHGSSTKELEENFHNLIDFHIQSVEADDKTYSGNITLRIPPQTHAELARMSKLQGTSINKFITQKLQNSV